MTSKYKRFYTIFLCFIFISLAFCMSNFCIVNKNVNAVWYPEPGTSGGDIVEPSETYDITLDKAGGQGGSSSISVVEGELQTYSIALPQKSGYEFLGYFNEDNVQYVDNLGIVDDTKNYASAISTLYAHWTPIEYTITYYEDSVGQDLVTTNPITYTIETPTFSLSAPNKENYTFVGWTYGGQSTPIMSVNIEKGTIGNKVYIAHFVVKEFNVTFQRSGTNSQTLFVYVFDSVNSFIMQTTLNNNATTISLPSVDSNDKLIEYKIKIMPLSMGKVNVQESDNYNVVNNCVFIQNSDNIKINYSYTTTNFNNAIII